jgi:hypothetical protein
MRAAFPYNGAMDRALRDLVQAVHSAPPQTMIVTAGAGTQALHWLLSVAGASRTLLEAVVPYSRRSFYDFLGQQPSQHVADSTGRLLAGRALTRARQLRETTDQPVIGLACTATIATDRPKRGAHRAHVASWQNERLVTYALFLEKGRRGRPGEEKLVSRLLINALAAAYGLPGQLPLDLKAGDTLESTRYDYDAAIEKLRQGAADFIGIHDHGRIRVRGVQPQVLLPGSFNPLHQGHLALAAAAEETLNRPVAFELAARNVDKEPLDRSVMLDRIAQFAGRYPLYLSNAPTFVEKARLFRNCTFVVGFDTAVRIVDPRYYDGSDRQMRAALTEFREHGGRFLVAGRVGANGVFQAAGNLTLPVEAAGLFSPIPGDRFRIDISSTELRAKGERGSR